jgi:UDP-2,3-diacylglucosamine hydrolase
MSSTFFISDLHLDPVRPAVSEALANFLQEHIHCDALYILGDLFDAWVGDDDDAPIAIETVRTLKAFSDAGPALYIMVGNRDFLLGEKFCVAAGATLLDDPTLVDLYGVPTLLMHGDSLCIGDTEYQAFRRKARDPRWQAELLGKSLAERRALATDLRGMSKEANSNKAEDIMDVTPEEVARHMSLAGSSRLIHGHTHRPAQHSEAHGERWVLGDWDQKGWTIRVSQEEIELIKFNINQ